EQSFERIGGKETIHVDLRLVAATNKDLHEEIRHGRFRDDLYYRLNVIEILIPALRERKDDIPLLVDFFLQSFSEKYSKPRPRIAGSSLLKLCSFHWPGNIRQLKNYMERLTVLDLGTELDRDIESLTDAAPVPTGIPTPSDELLLESLEDAELKYIQHVL